MCFGKGRIQLLGGKGDGRALFEATLGKKRLLGIVLLSFHPEGSLRGFFSCREEHQW